MHVLVCMSWSSRALVLETFRQQENWINWEELPCFWKVVQLEIRPQPEVQEVQDLSSSRGGGF